MMDVLGWVGSMLLMLCALPEAVNALRSKTTGMGWMFLGMWSVGLACMLFPAIFVIKESYLTLTYVLNLTFVVIIMYIKWREE